MRGVLYASFINQFDAIVHTCEEMVTCSDAEGAAGGGGDGDAAGSRGAAAGEEHIVGRRGVAVQVRAD